MLAEPIQTTLEQGVPLDRGHVLRRRPRDHGRVTSRTSSHHRGRRGALPGRRTARIVPVARQPAEHIPPVVAHLTGIDDRLVAARTADRTGVARASCEFARGADDRRPQRPVRLLVPQREPRGPGLPARCPDRPVCTAQARPPVVWPDVPEREAAHARRVLPDPSAAHPPRARRRRGLRRGAARLAGVGRTARHPHARRSPRGRSGHEAGPTSARSVWPTPCPMPPASTCSAGARDRCSTWASPTTCGPRGEVLLLRRRAQEDRAPARRGPHGRGHRMRGRTRGPGRRSSPDPHARAAVQPPGQDVAHAAPTSSSIRPRPTRGSRSCTSAQGDDASVYLGPFPTSARAREVKEALEDPSSRSAAARPPCGRRHGSRRAPSPTWAGASLRATAGPTPSATESSSASSSPP